MFLNDPSTSQNYRLLRIFSNGLKITSKSEMPKIRRKTFELFVFVLAGEVDLFDPSTCPDGCCLPRQLFVENANDDDQNLVENPRVNRQN